MALSLSANSVLRRPDAPSCTPSPPPPPTLWEPPALVAPKPTLSPPPLGGVHAPTPLPPVGPAPHPPLLSAPALMGPPRTAPSCLPFLSAPGPPPSNPAQHVAPLAGQAGPHPPTFIDAPHTGGASPPWRFSAQALNLPFLRCQHPASSFFAAQGHQQHCCAPSFPSFGPHTPRAGPFSSGKCPFSYHPPCYPRSSPPPLVPPPLGYLHPCCPFPCRPPPGRSPPCCPPAPCCLLSCSLHPCCPHP